MRYFTLSFKNIKNFIILHPILFAFLILVQIVCCVEVFISCGMAYNLNYVEKRYVFQDAFNFGFIGEESNYGEMFIKDNGKINKRFIKNDPVSGDNVEVHELNYSGALLFSEYKDKFEEFLRLTEKYKINSANLRLYTNNLIKNTEDSIATEEYNTYFPMYSSDSGIINVKGQTYDISNYIDSSENIIFSYIQSKECPFSKGEKYFINNIEFKCIGDYIETFIPYNSVPDDFVVGVFSVKYDAVLINLAIK